jgi:hypothetical protein
MGFTHSDHFHPGSKTVRLNVVSPMVTISIRPFGTSRTSSGDSIDFFRIVAALLMVPPGGWVSGR